MKETFENIYNFFKGNIIFNVATFILGSLGVCLSIFYYYKSKRSKSPIYMVRSVNIIRKNLENIDKVEIHYSGNKVEDLSITKIALWNNGKDTINSNDIAKNNPVKIVICDANHILQAELIYEKNSANAFKIQLAEDQKSVSIDFDYFDYEEGIVVRLVHTASSSQDISVIGTVKTVKQLVRRDAANLIILGLNTRRKRTAYAVFFIGIFSIIFGLFVLLKPGIVSEMYLDSPNIISASIIISGFLYLFIGLYGIRRRTPKGFNLFEGEF